MRTSFIILLLVLAANALAQPPRIDSMRVDEGHDELTIFGDFDWYKGAVTIDSVSMDVRSWSDSVIVTKLPESGRGYAGPVVVGSRGYQSEPRMLTAWSMGGGCATWYHGNTWSEYAYEIWWFSWRADIESGLRRGVTPSFQIDLRTSEVYTYHYDWYDPGNTSNSKREDRTHWGSGIVSGQCDTGNLSFTFTVKDWVSDTYTFSTSTMHVALDTFLVPQSSGNGWLHWGDAQVTPTSVKFPPRFVALRYSPSLTSPASGTRLDGGDSAMLLWSSQGWYDRYRLQIASDSLFSQIITDTVTANTSYHLAVSRNTSTMFWRVRGITSDGESKWTAAWRIEIRSKLDHAPILISPTNDSIFVTPGPIVLRWHSLKFMDGYVIEYTMDSSVFGSFQTTTVQDTEVAISVPYASTQYYWRVAGRNSDGQSLWSLAWNFWSAPDPASVNVDSSEPRSIRCTPNPATNVLNLTLPAPARVVLHDLRGNIVRSVATSEPTLRIETGDIANGTYIVGVFANGKRQSQIVSIVH